jgi:putative hydrolase of the HAD superfamily
LTQPLVSSMERFARTTGIELHDLVRAALGAYAGEEDALVTDFETGKITEAEFSRALATRLSELAGRSVAAEGLVTRIFDLELEPKMLELVETVRRAGVRTSLLSNSWGSELYPMAEIERLFDDVVISGQVGLRKPDPAIFRLAARRLEVGPERCVCVDDHLGHVEAARSVGMIGILHTSAERTEREVRRVLSIDPASPSGQR